VDAAIICQAWGIFGFNIGIHHEFIALDNIKNP
jgi:hypothetical protein